MSKRKPNAEDSPRSCRPRAAGELIGGIGDQSFKRFGFVQRSIVSRWVEIVGTRYSRVSSPESIRFPAGKKSGGALTLLVEGAHAPLIQHLTPLIIERVNRFFGYAAVDTNVIRVISRLDGLGRAAEASIPDLVLAMTPARHPGDFVQALMDLGATICRPRNPRCALCPLQGDCAAYAGGNPEAFPEPRQRKPRPHKHGIAYWTERDGHVWLVRRPAKGLLGGMVALPGTEWSEAQPAPPSHLACVRHVFTHFSLDLHIVRGAGPAGEGWWHPLGEIDRAGLPTLYLKAVEAVAGSNGRIAA